jgi:hypothetical protein
MSLLFKSVISTLVVKVNKVLDSIPDVPLACKSLTVTLVFLSPQLVNVRKEAIPPQLAQQLQLVVMFLVGFSYSSKVIICKKNGIIFY